MNWLKPVARMLFALVLVGCAEVEVEQQPSENIQPKPTVFLLGTEWVDAGMQEHRISLMINDTTLVPMVEPSYGWYAFDFFTDGTDSYVLGYRSSKSMVWKNGILLNDTSTWFMYSSMEVVSGNLYVTGWEQTGSETPTLWKNTIPMHLPFTDPSFDDGRAYDVAISGSDEYVVGYEFDVHGATSWHAMLWKNGEPQILSTEVVAGEGARPMAVAVSGSDVYMVGFGYAPNGNPMALYWKNGEPSVLEYPFDRGNLSWATDIVVYNGDVHIAGHDSYGAAIYWKNGLATVLPGTSTDLQPPSKINHVSSVFVFEGNVYISGTETTNSSHAIYWKNGIPTVVPKLFDASNIFVMRPPEVK